MKTFGVQAWEEQGAYFTVKAKNQKDADDIVYEHINEHGIDWDTVKKTKSIVKMDVTHRGVNLL